MRATVHDAHGPRRWRVFPYALPSALLAFSFWGPLSGTPAVVVGFVALFVFNLIGIVTPRQRRPRDAELAFGPGYLDVEKAGIRNQRITAKDVTGATTARTSQGVLLTLQHRDRHEPLTIQVANDAEAERVRHALGIGHGGYGTVVWRTRIGMAPLIGRIAAVSAIFFTTFVGLLVSWKAAQTMMPLLGMIGFVGALLGVIGLLGSPAEPTILMTSEGLRLRTSKGWFALPYEFMQHLEDHPKAFVFSVPPPFGTIGVERTSPSLGGLSDADRRILVAQVNAASQRARGMGPQKNDVTGRLDVLRRNGESARDWLMRLDMAGQMLSAGPGYRGNTLDVQDLWAILEDPEADADLRAAAARVLRHSPSADSRVRIDAAVAAVRDEHTSRRLRIAVRDDVDNASEELAYLDASDPTRRRMQR